MSKKSWRPARAFIFSYQKKERLMYQQGGFNMKSKTFVQDDL